MNTNTIKHNKDRINEIIHGGKRVKTEEIALPLPVTIGGKIVGNLKNKLFYIFSFLHQQEKIRFFIMLVACLSDAT
jgi:hypothetical protein